MDGQRRVIADGAIAIAAGQIVAVDRREALEAFCRAAQRIDATGQKVIPGLINGHALLPMTLFRGLADDQDLDDWLQHTIFPAEAMNVDEPFVRSGTRLGVAELIRGGITTVCDMDYDESAVAEELAAAGLRGLLGQALIDCPAPDAADHDGAMGCIARFVDRWMGHPLITPAIAPRALFARDRGCPLVIHLAETRHEVEESLRLKGAWPVDHLARLGVLSGRMVVAHVVWAEMATIRGARALHLEGQIGALEVGKRADVVLLEMEAITDLQDLYLKHVEHVALELNWSQHIGVYSFSHYLSHQLDTAVKEGL
jgi:5-methylthioadenosine/S-adenosylhomocysteine deaminase